MVEIGRHLAYGGPMLLGFSSATCRIGATIPCSGARPSIETVGQFGLSHQIFSTMLAANGALSTLLLPRLVASQSRSNEASGRYVRDVVPTLFVLWALAATATVAVLPPLLMAAAALVSHRRRRPCWYCARWCPPAC